MRCCVTSSSCARIYAHAHSHNRASNKMQTIFYAFDIVSYAHIHINIYTSDFSFSATRHNYYGNDDASVCLSVELFRCEVTPCQG